MCINCAERAPAAQAGGGSGRASPGAGVPGRLRHWSGRLGTQLGQLREQVGAQLRPGAETVSTQLLGMLQRGQGQAGRLLSPPRAPAAAAAPGRQSAGALLCAAPKRPPSHARSCPRQALRTARSYELIASTLRKAGPRPACMHALHCAGQYCLGMKVARVLT